MPSYRPILTQYMDGANVLVRLTRTDTVALKARLEDALDRNTGVNLVFMGMNNAMSLTTSDEKGRQIKCIAYNKSGFRVTSPMQGYNGPWSHIEIVMPLSCLAYMKTFANKVENQQPELIGATL